jgi:diguanylate cyclase (GGDEF)-like protein
MAEGQSRAGNVRGALRSPFPWIALAIPLVATILVWQALWRDAARDASHQFARLTESAEAAFRARVQANEQMLVAGAAFLGASKDVTRAEWAEYITRLKLTARYPGIQAMGFAERVRLAERDAHVKRVRADGLAEYDIRPPGERDTYVPIVYSEPFRGRNARVVGLDTFNQPVLRVAIDRAFEVSDVAITEKVVLPGEDASGAETTQPGIVMYLPVFRAGKPLASKEERDAALLGFVFATFRMTDLAAGVLDRSLAQAVDMAVYDGGRLVPEALLAGPADKPAGAPVFQRASAFDLGGRQWTLAFGSRPEFEARAQDAIAISVLGVGLAVSAALFVLTLLLVAARNRAADMSTRDTLTQLFNTRYLEETMGLELARAKRAQQAAALILIDVDRFKEIEGEFGLGCGEQLLKQVARLLDKNTRDSDITCRLGGAQFAVGMPGANADNARMRAEVLRAALESTPIECGGKSLGQVTLSAGAAAYPQHGEDWASLLQRAHRALYAAKGAGRNRVTVAD